VVFGTLAEIKQRLAAHGWQINTAFIERVNLSIRPHVAAVGRRVTTVCKGAAGLRQQLALHQVYYNFFCPMSAYACPYHSPHRRKGRAQRNAGGRVHRRWPRD
jgi:hypothetical protein